MLHPQMTHLEWSSWEEAIAVPGSISLFRARYRKMKVDHMELTMPRDVHHAREFKLFEGSSGAPCNQDAAQIDLE